jgi:2-polyprenyl-3-methyl-5-hydroxy-6-metoxy-1,4-benzoquinol methylase
MSVIDKGHSPFIHKKRQYIEVPLAMKCGAFRRILHGIGGVLVLPFYLLAAWILKTPGVGCHLRIALLAMRLFIRGRISLRRCFWLICAPMDSTRYFEFDEALKGLADIPFKRYLDVSSPRLVALMLLTGNKVAAGEMINPDSRDIEETRQLAEASGLAGRCRFTSSTIEKAEFAPESFDLITCISVLEHIPSDREAVERMWTLLCPGGRLVVTLPCMAKSLEQYISRNDYGLLSPETDGYTFWQRFYDEERLKEVIFKITGPPAKMVVYGEKSYGLFYRSASMKRLLDSLYPFWRESYMMGTEYRYFKTIDELPGEGVVMLEFVKP